MFDLEEYKELGSLVYGIDTFSESVKYINNCIDRLEPLNEGVAYHGNFTVLSEIDFSIYDRNDFIYMIDWKEFIDRGEGKYIVLRHIETSEDKSISLQSVTNVNKKYADVLLVMAIKPTNWTLPEMISRRIREITENCK